MAHAQKFCPRCGLEEGFKIIGVNALGDPIIVDNRDGFYDDGNPHVPPESPSVTISYELYKELLYVALTRGDPAARSPALSRVFRDYGDLLLRLRKDYPSGAVSVLKARGNGRVATEETGIDRPAAPIL